MSFFSRLPVYDISRRTAAFFSSINRVPILVMIFCALACSRTRFVGYIAEEMLTIFVRMLGKETPGTYDVAHIRNEQLDELHDPKVERENHSHGVVELVGRIIVGLKRSDIIVETFSL